MFPNAILFVLFTRIVAFATGFSIGSGTRTQWKETGLMEKMQSTLFLRILGYLQVCLCSSLISETILWMTVGMSDDHQFYNVGEARFTMQGIILVNQTTISTILGFAIPIVLSDEHFEQMDSVCGEITDRIQSAFWIASSIIGLQVLRANYGPYAFVSFCTIRMIAFANISQEYPVWHLLAYFGLCLLGNPLRTSGALFASDLYTT